MSVPSDFTSPIKNRKRLPKPKNNASGRFRFHGFQISYLIDESYYNSSADISGPLTFDVLSCKREADTASLRNTSCRPHSHSSQSSVAPTSESRLCSIV